MPIYRRRALNLRPVKSEKEEITFSNLSQNASTTQSIIIVKGASSPSATGQVEIGDTVKWIFMEVNFSAETVTTTKIIHWIIQVNLFGQSAATPNLYDEQLKSSVIKRGMEMVPKDVNTIIKRIMVINIPKKYQRISDGASVNFRYIASSSETVNVCGNFIYKHFG